MSWIDFAKPGLDVAECNYVAIGDGSCFAVRNTRAIYVRAVGGTGVSNQQILTCVHLQSGMHLRYAWMIQVQIVVRAATDIKTAAAGDESQFHFFRSFRQSQASNHRYFGFLGVRRFEGLA